MLALRRFDHRALLRPAGAALGSAALAALCMHVVPAGGDASAHYYRTLLVRLGSVVWDNLWYSGQYPLGSYSFLYYWPAALVGNTAVAVAAAALGSLAFAALVVPRCTTAAWLPLAAYAVAAGLAPLTGQYPFLAGIAALLWTLLLLERGHPVLATLAAALTLGFNPLAFAFLLLVLAAVAIGRRSWGPKRFLVGLAAVAALGAALSRIFGLPWTAYPFPATALASVLQMAAIGAALSFRTARGHVLGIFFVLWGVVSVILFKVPTPVGVDIARPLEFVLPLVIVATLVGRATRPRRRGFVVLAIVVAAAFNLGPYRSSLTGASHGGSIQPSLWQPALGYLETHRPTGFRVEVVPTAGHWESYYLPRAGFALARGWYRQLDLTANRVLYRPTLTAASYRRWLSDTAVKYVLLPSRIALDGWGARAEQRLLRSGISGLRKVFDSGGWSIWVVPNPTPIVTGPAPVALTFFGHDRIAGWTAGAGRFMLRIRYMPYWNATRGKVCIEPGRNGTSTLVAARPGRFELVTLGMFHLLNDATATCVRGKATG